MDDIRAALREGRAKLKEGNGAAGMVFFNKAKMISKMRGEKVQLRRAMRGLAACRRMGGDKLGAIEDLEVVLQLSKEMNDFTGCVARRRPREPATPPRGERSREAQRLATG